MKADPTLLASSSSPNPSPRSGWLPWSAQQRERHDGDDPNDDSGNEDNGGSGSWNPFNATATIQDIVTQATLPQIAAFSLRSLLTITLALYILNQKHMLNRPLSAFVSKTLFWPTLPITAGRRIGKWLTPIDDTVVMGGAPLRCIGMPRLLREQYNVHGVINLCEEYDGPTDLYRKLGMEELHLPTTDHFEPALQDLISAVKFIQRHEAEGKRVYVHCRAGHGRSAAVVFSWLLYNDPLVDLQVLNTNLCSIRNVRKTLWKQTNIRKLHSKLIIDGNLGPPTSSPSPSSRSSSSFSSSTVPSPSPSSPSTLVEHEDINRDRHQPNVQSEHPPEEASKDEL